MYVTEIRRCAVTSSRFYGVLTAANVPQPIRAEDDLRLNHDFPRVDYRTFHQVVLLSAGSGGDREGMNLLTAQSPRCPRVSLS